MLRTYRDAAPPPACPGPCSYPPMASGSGPSPNHDISHSPNRQLAIRDVPIPSRSEGDLPPVTRRTISGLGDGLRAIKRATLSTSPHPPVPASVNRSRIRHVEL